MRQKYFGWIAFRGMIVAVALLLLSSAFGQTADAYRLQPEDLIRIQVYRTSSTQDQILADVPVDRNGNVSAPFAGTLRAAGKTTVELETELAKRYIERLRLRDPIVSVTVLRFRRILASIGGGVGRPGQYEMRPGDTLLDLLNMGGGATQDRADLRRATLKRSGSREVIPVDLYAMLFQGDTSQNFGIEDGDVLNVPEESRNRILVLGAVQTPGTYPYREPMTLADAISLARGEIRYRSKFSQTIILRERPGLPGQYYRIVADFVRFVKKNDQTQNIELKPGDLVYVPETNTPDFQQISSLANVAFILDRFGGGIFGINIFSR